MPLSLESILGQAAYLLADMREHLKKQASWDSRASFLVESCDDFFSEAASSVAILLTKAPASPEPISAPPVEKSGLGWKSPLPLDGIRTEPSALFTPLGASPEEPSFPRISPSQTNWEDSLPGLSSPKPSPICNGKKPSGRVTLAVDFF